jgi:hypothetical protein
MPNVSAYYAVAIFGCLTGGALLVPPAAASDQTIIDSPRPVAAAIKKIEAVYGWPVTYEDPPYAFSGDLVDMAARYSKPDAAPWPVPRGGTFALQLESAAKLEFGERSSEGSARDAILAMLKSYSASVGGDELFTLTESDGLFHVVPVQRKDRSGKLEKIAPLLDAPLSISPNQANGDDVLTTFCKAVTQQTGEQVHLVTNWQSPSAYTFPAPRSGETARSYLSRFLAGEGWPAPVSYALHYQPNLGYQLSVQRVFTEGMKWRSLPAATPAR